MEHLGLVGLPNSGKSSLFNALTGAATVVAPHAFSTTETTVGVATVPDARVDRLAEMSESKKRVYTGFQVVDIAALVKGSSTGEGLGNRFLGALRDCDALLFVLRAFDDPSVIGEADPRAALLELELELVLADLASVEGRIDRQRRAAKGDASILGEVAALERALAALSDGVPVYRAGLSDEERAALAPVFLLTNKRTLVVVNIGEDQLGDADAIATPFGDDALAVCLQLEAEAAELEPDARAELLEGLGLGEGVVPRVVARRVPRPRAAHLPHHRRQGVARVDLPRRGEGSGGCRLDPLRSAARVHPGRGHRLAGAARHRVVEQGEGAGPHPRGRQGVRGRRRRRPRDPVQRVSA